MRCRFFFTTLFLQVSILCAFAQFEGHITLPTYSAAFGEASNNQYAADLRVAADGASWLLSRKQTGPEGESIGIVAGFDASGTTLFEARLDAPAGEDVIPLALAPAADGGCYVAVLFTRPVTSQFLVPSEGDLHFYHLAADGTIESAALLREGVSVARARLVETTDGRPALGLLAADAPRFDFLLLNPDGTVRAERDYGGTVTAGGFFGNPPPIRGLALPDGEVIFGMLLGDRDVLYAFDSAGDLSRGAPVPSGDFATGIGDLLYEADGTVLVANASFGASGPGVVSPQLHRFDAAGELETYAFTAFPIASFNPTFRLTRRPGGYYLIYQPNSTYAHLPLDDDLGATVTEPQLLVTEFINYDAQLDADAAGNLYFTKTINRDAQLGIELVRTAPLSGTAWEREIRTGGAGGEEGGERLVRRPGGGYVVAGERGGTGTETDVWLLWLDARGTLEREVTRTRTGYDQVIDLYSDDDRFYLLTGEQDGRRLSAYNFDGDVIWEVSLTGANFSSFERSVIHRDDEADQLLLSGRRGDVFRIDRQNGNTVARGAIGRFQQDYPGYIEQRVVGSDYLVLLGAIFENGRSLFELILLEYDGRERARFPLSEYMDESLFRIEYVEATADAVRFAARGADADTGDSYSEVFQYDLTTNSITAAYRLNTPLEFSLQSVALPDGGRLFSRGGSLVEYRDAQLHLTGRYLFPLNITDIIATPGGAWAATGTLPRRGGIDLGWQLVEATGRQVLFQRSPEPELTVYPNPTFGLVNFTLNNAYTGPVDWSLHYLDGRQLATGTVDKAETVLAQRIQLHNSTAGVYLLRIRYDEETVTHRIVVR